MSTHLIHAPFAASAARTGRGCAYRPRRTACVLACAALALLCSSAQAATVNWQCSNADWANIGCWTGGAVPSASDDAVIVGANGTQSSHTSGSHSVKSLYLSPANGTTQLTLSGGTLTSPKTTIDIGTTFLMQGGTLNASSYALGNVFNQGSFSYSGGTLTSVGLSNFGTLNLNANMTVDGLGSSGSINGLGSGRTLTVNTGGLAVTNGTLTLSGGTVTGLGSISNVNGVINGWGAISGSGVFDNSLGSLLVNSSGNTLSYSKNGDIQNASNGLIVVSSGTTLALQTLGGIVNSARVVLNGGTVSGSGYVQNNAGGTLSGGGTLGVFLQNTGGTVQVNGGNMLQITQAFTNTGTVTLAGTASNAGSTALQGGTLTNGNGGVIGGRGRIDNPVVNQAGSSVQVASGASLSFTNSFEAQAGSSVAVAGDGTLSLFGTSVILGNNASFTGTGWTQIGGAGSGTLLTVGNGPGAASFEGNLYLYASTYAVDIGGTQSGTDYDKLSLGGQLQLNGANLKLTSYNGYVAQLGQSFSILAFGSEIGTFSSIDTSGLLLAAGTRLDTSNLYVNGTLAVVAVPEPATWLTLATGLLWLGRRRCARARG
jgi:hypothetical protein